MLQLSCSRNISFANNKKVKTSFSFPVVCLVIFSIHVVDSSKHSKYLAMTEWTVYLGHRVRFSGAHFNNRIRSFFKFGPKIILNRYLLIWIHNTFMFGKKWLHWIGLSIFLNKDVSRNFIDRYLINLTFYATDVFNKV